MSIRNIYLEEDLLVFEDLSVSLLSLQRDMDEVHRLDDVRQGLLDLYAMAGAIPRASVEHVALFQIAGNLATAGSDYSAELFFPAMESYVGTSVSTEGLGEVIKRLWERIVALVKRIVSGFSKFWDSVFDGAARTRRYAQQLKFRADGTAGSRIDNPTIVVKREINRLSLRGKAPNNGEEIFRGLVQSRAQANVILTSYMDGVTACGVALEKALAKTDLSAEDYLKNVIVASRSLRLPFVASALDSKEYRDIRFSAGEVEAAPPLLGNRTLFITPLGLTRGDNPSLLGQAEAARRVGIRLLQSEPRSQEPMYNYEMPTVPSQLCSHIAKAAMDLSTDIERFVQSSRKTMLREMNKRLLKTADRAKNEMYVKHLTQTDSHYVESAIRFNLSFASWTANPHDALVTHLLSVCRAALVVIDRSLANHH